MKIVIDFGHPAHVHYFKHFIKEMTDNGYEIMCFARERYPIQDLLKAYNIEAINRGKGYNSVIGKVWNTLRIIYLMYRNARSFKPDICMSFGGLYTTLLAQLVRAKAISLDDTETAKWQQIICLPLVDLILTPSCYKIDLGKKQIKFPGTMDMAYLHPNRFTPNESVLDELGLEISERFAIVRFVSWNAHHDVGCKGMTLANKIRLVKELSGIMRVFVSSEGEIPGELREHQCSIMPQKMHDVLYYAHMIAGESGTMSSEAAILGTSAVIVNNDGLGCIEYFRDIGLLFMFTDSIADQERAILKAIEIAKNDHLKEENNKVIQGSLSKMIDFSSFLVWLVEHYPQSKRDILSVGWSFDRFMT